MEAAAAYYAAAAQRQRTKQLDLSGALGTVPPEINVAVAFKVGAAAGGGGGGLGRTWHQGAPCGICR
jgi:hypothetical protein